MTDLCPACGKNEVGFNPSGFCDACTVDRAAERYSQADRDRAAKRTALWGVAATKTRTDARLAALRQQRRRLIATIRPLADATSSDPWEIGAEALARCKRLMQSFPAARSELEEICEAIRRVCWGPDDSEAAWIVNKPRHRKQIPGQMVLFGDSLAVAA